MRVPKLALALAAAAAIGWSGIVVVASAAPPKCADLDAVPADIAPVPAVLTPASTTTSTSSATTTSVASPTSGTATSTSAAPTPATPGPGQTCQIQRTDPAYSLDIVFPLDFPDQKSVLDYVKQTRDGFLNVAKSGSPRDMPYELDTTMTQYSSAVPPRGTQSVVFKTYQSVGGAHPQTFYQAFNWDQSYRKPITIDNLFKEGTAPFPLILPVVQAEATKQFGEAASISPGTGLDPSKYQNFAITNDAIVFFFDQGELLPEATGAFSVSVPRGPIDSMIA
jgi:Protein of unknown function (DUF3298)